MLDIDTSAAWWIGRRVFATWFTSTTLIGTLFFVRQTTQLTRAKCVAVAVATTTVSWLLVAAVPLPLVVSGFMNEILQAHFGSVGWISALLASAVIGTASGGAVLAVFGQRITRSGIAILWALNLFCVGLTFYRIVAQLIAHPPEA
jgi:hypothetical protein